MISQLIYNEMPMSVLQFRDRLYMAISESDTGPNFWWWFPYMSGPMNDMWDMIRDAVLPVEGNGGRHRQVYHRGASAILRRQRAQQT